VLWLWGRSAQIAYGKKPQEGDDSPDNLWTDVAATCFSITDVVFDAFVYSISLYCGDGGSIASSLVTKLKADSVRPGWYTESYMLPGDAACGPEVCLWAISVVQFVRRVMQFLNPVAFSYAVICAEEAVGKILLMTCRSIPMAATSQASASANFDFCIDEDQRARAWLLLYAHCFWARCIHETSGSFVDSSTDSLPRKLCHTAIVELSGTLSQAAASVLEDAGSGNTHCVRDAGESCCQTGPLVTNIAYADSKVPDYEVAFALLYAARHILGLFEYLGGSPTVIKNCQQTIVACTEVALTESVEKNMKISAFHADDKERNAGRKCSSLGSV